MEGGSIHIIDIIYHSITQPHDVDAIIQLIIYNQIPQNLTMICNSHIWLTTFEPSPSFLDGVCGACVAM